MIIKEKNGSTFQSGTIFQNGFRVELFWLYFFLSVVRLLLLIWNEPYSEGAREPIWTNNRALEMYYSAWNDLPTCMHNLILSASITVSCTEASIPEFSIGECMMPNILKIAYEEKWSPYPMLTSIVSDVHQFQRSCCLTRRSVRILALWEDNSFKCPSQHRSKQIQTSPLIHTSTECSSLNMIGSFLIKMALSQYHPLNHFKMAPLDGINSLGGMVLPQ